MVDEPHAVVKLLVARMESHPEEFKSDVRGRWDDVVDEVSAWGNETDRAAMNVKLRDIRLDEAHADALEELLNGPERRRRQEEEREYEKQMLVQQAQKSSQMAAQQYARQYQNAAGSFGKPLSAARHPTSADMENNGILNSIRNILK
jgi:hypothetical protein